jgi:hypothetical protein
MCCCIVDLLLLYCYYCATTFVVKCSVFVVIVCLHLRVLSVLPLLRKRPLADYSGMERTLDVAPLVRPAMVNVTAATAAGPPHL